MNDQLTIKYSCPKCGLKNVTFLNRPCYSKAELDRWTKVMIRNAGFDHLQRSLFCDGIVRNVVVPYDDKEPGGWIGKYTPMIPKDYEDAAPTGGPQPIRTILRPDLDTAAAGHLAVPGTEIFDSFESGGRCFVRHIPSGKAQMVAPPDEGGNFLDQELTAARGLLQMVDGK